MSMLLTVQEFDEACANVVGWVTEVLEQEPQHSFTPTLVLHCHGPIPRELEEKVVHSVPGGYADEKRSVIMVLMPEMDMEKRYSFLHRVGTNLGATGLELLAVFFVAEAWVSVYPVPAKGLESPLAGEKEVQQRRVPLPAEDPNRQEVVAVMGMTIDRKVNVGQVSVERDENNFMKVQTVALSKSQVSDLGAGRPCAHFLQGYAAGYLAHNARERARR